MLQYVRGETPPLVAVDLGDIVRGVLRVIDRIIPGSVTVEVQLSELARPVRGAPAELEQLVLNLAINALDAMPHGGVLTIRVQPTGATATFLEVRDTGRGIETPRPGRRTGLGLGIVRRVVARHDGAVKVVSGSRGGTVATVFLPTA
jgi:signal transduction histidine kinase